MSGMAYVVCEGRDAEEWHAEARFLVGSASGFQKMLGAVGLNNKGHPHDLSATVQTDLLLEECEVRNKTFISFPEISRLSVVATAEDYPRLAAWEGFLSGLENSGKKARLIVWFVY